MANIGMLSLTGFFSVLPSQAQIIDFERLPGLVMEPVDNQELRIDQAYNINGTNVQFGFNTMGGIELQIPAYFENRTNDDFTGIFANSRIGYTSGTTNLIPDIDLTGDKIGGGIG